MDDVRRSAGSGLTLQEGLILDDFPVAILVLGVRGVIEVNAEWTALSGLGSEASLGGGWLEAVHPEDRPTIHAVLDGYDGGVVEKMVRFPSTEGVQQPVLLRIKAVAAEPVPLIVIVASRRPADDRLMYLSSHDELTGLLNRCTMLSAIHDQLAARLDLTAMLFIDLDGFKEVNDGLGHRFGDAILSVIGQRLRASVRTCDSVGRLGGDEFGVLCSCLPSRSEVCRLADRIGDAIKAPIAFNGRILQISASIGVAFASGDGQTAEALVHQADTAMYQAKGSGGAQWVVFEPSMTTRRSSERVLVSASAARRRSA